MEQKILDILSQMQQDMRDMKEDISSLKTDVAVLKTDVSDLKTDVSDLKTDVSSIKETVERLEVQQAEDVVALLHEINSKTEAIRKHQEETDEVIDVLAARTIRLEAKVKLHYV